jgi:DNA-binding IclR family transcriptional regulator
MTLLSVVKDVCAVVGVLVPTSVFSNITTNRTMQEMLALANEMAQRIAYDTRDWTR